MMREPCHCRAYAFPHRVGGGDCDRPRPLKWSERDDDYERLDRDDLRALKADDDRDHANYLEDTKCA